MTLHPPGGYDAEVVAIRSGTSFSGTDRLEVDLRPSDGPVELEESLGGENASVGLPDLRAAQEPHLRHFEPSPLACRIVEDDDAWVGNRTGRFVRGLARFALAGW